MNHAGVMAARGASVVCLGPCLVAAAMALCRHRSLLQVTSYGLRRWARSPAPAVIRIDLTAGMESGVTNVTSGGVLPVSTVGSGNASGWLVAAMLYRSLASTGPR